MRLANRGYSWCEARSHIDSPTLMRSEARRRRGEGGEREYGRSEAQQQQHLAAVQLRGGGVKHVRLSYSPSLVCIEAAVTPGR